MRPFRSESGLLASIPMANIDTDVIMPKQFLKGIDRQGLDRGVFYDLRSNPSAHPDFALNQAGLAAPHFLVTGPNFGCGSSREHAVWGLVQFGIRAIIGTTFGGIFADNALNNGLLILRCPEEVVTRLDAQARPIPCEITVDLERQTIVRAHEVLRFDISAEHRAALLSGHDAIARSAALLGDFASFEERYLAERQWLVASTPHVNPGEGRS